MLRSTTGHYSAAIASMVKATEGFHERMTRIELALVKGGLATEAELKIK